MAEQKAKVVHGPGPRGMGGPRPKVENPGRLLKRIMAEVFQHYLPHCILVLICIVVSALANVQASLFLQTLIDDYIIPMTQQQEPSFAPLAGALMRVGCIYVVGILAAWLNARIMVNVTQGTLRNLRIQLFTHMESLPIRYFDTHPHGDIMSVYTNDVDTLRQMLSQSIPQLVSSAITIVSVFASMCMLSWQLTIVTMLMVALMMFCSKKITQQSGKFFIAQQRDLGKVNGYIEEMMEGQKVVKVFTHEQKTLEGFRELNDKLKDSAKQANSFANIIMPVTAQLGNISYAICALAGAAMAVSGVGSVTLGTVMAFLALNKSFNMPISQVSMQANSIIMEIEHARMQLTADPRERIRLLKRDIEERQKEIDELEHSEALEKLTSEQVGDIIGVIHNTLRGVPIDLRELALSERDNGDALRRRMQAGAMSVESILTAYHDEYRRAFRESDSGRRFEDAFQVIVTDEGRREIDDAVRDIARNPYLDGEPSVLLNQVRSELKRIYEGIEDVRRQIRTSDEAVSRLVRQQTDTSYRTMLAKLNQLFAKTSAEAKAHPNDQSRPYHTDAGQAKFPTLPSRPARSMARAASSSLNDAPAATIEAPDLKNMVEICGPRLTRMIRLIRSNPVTTSDGMFVDLAASFNQLPKAERRESELVGFLSALRTQDDSSYVTWRCISIDGSERVWRTKPILTTETTLDDIIEER